jgi:hypothetical protein
MIYLHVTFTVEAHQIARYERAFGEEFLPIIQEHGFEAVGIWKTLVGAAGEFTEIWRFDDLADYEKRWGALLSDPRVAAIFETTGPLVKNETFKLMAPADFPSPTDP